MQNPQNQPRPPGENPKDTEVTVVNTSTNKQKFLNPIQGQSAWIDSKSNVEAFNRYLEQDLRIPTSEYAFDLKTQKTIDSYKVKFYLWRDAIGHYLSYLRSKKLILPPQVIYILGIPAIGYFLASEQGGLNNPYQYRLPSSLPGLAKILKTSGQMDWDSVVGTQFFHRIDWHDVNKSNYQNDDSFVLFSPNMSFKMQDHFLAGFESEKQSPVQDVIDLYPIAKNKFGVKPLFSSMHSLLKTTTININTINKPLLKPLVRYKKLKVKSTNPTYTNDLVIDMVKDVNLAPTSEMKRLRYSSTTGNFLKNPRSISNHQFNDVSIGEQVIISNKNKSKKVMVKNGIRYKHSYNIVSSRDYHVLYRPQSINRINEKLHFGFAKKPKVKVRKLFKYREKVNSNYYWQTYFNAFDLIPLKMESMTFSNKVRHIPSERLGLDAALFLETERYKQYVFDKHTLDQKLDNLDRAKVYTKQVQKLVKDIDQDAEKLKTKTGNALVEFKKQAAKRKKKRGLLDLELGQHDVHVDNVKIFDSQQQVVYPQRESLEYDPSKNTLRYQDFKTSLSAKTIKKKLIKQFQEKYHLNSFTNGISEQKKSISPLFTINQSSAKIQPKSDQSFRYLPQFSPKQDVWNLEPKTKIDILTNAIHEQFQKTLVSKLAVRQSARYTLHNSLFNFKQILGRQVHQIKKQHKFCDHLTFSVNHILRDKIEPFDSTINLNHLNDKFFYRNLVIDTNYFNPYGNYSFDSLKQLDQSEKMQTQDKQMMVEQEDLVNLKQLDQIIEFEIDSNNQKNQLNQQHSDITKPLINLTIKPNYDKFDYNSYQRKHRRRLVFNNYLVLPYTQKNLFFNLNSDLVKQERHEDYNAFYERFFLQNITTVKPTFLEVLSKLPDDTTIADTQTPTQLENQEFVEENALFYVNQLNDLEPKQIEQIQHEGLRKAQREVKKEYESVHNTRQLVINSIISDAKPILIRLHEKVHKWGQPNSIERLLRLADKLADQYSFEGRWSLKKAVRGRVIKAYSPYLQRQLSGYLNPDASFRDKYVELLNWTNVVEKAKTIKLFNYRHRVGTLYYNTFKQFNKLGSMTSYSPLFRFTSGLPQYNYECFKRLTSLQNKQPVDFQQFTSVTPKANPFIYSPRLNFHGKTSTTYAIPFIHSDDKLSESYDEKQEKLDQELKTKRTQTSPLTQQKSKQEKQNVSKNVDHIVYNNLDEAFETSISGQADDDLQSEENQEKFSVNYELLAEHKLDKDDRTFARHPFTDPMQEYSYARQFNHTGLPALPVQPSQNLVSADNLMNKVRNRFFYDAYNHGYIDQSKLSVPSNKWIISRSYEEMPFPKDGTLYLSSKRVVPNSIQLKADKFLTPSYFSSLFLLYHAIQGLKRFNRDYRRPIVLGVYNFFSRLDVTSIQAVFRVNEAVVRCRAVGFDEIVGGAKLLHLFYPLILSMRNRTFFFGTLPIFEHSLLQTLASSSAGFVQREDRFDFEIIEPSEEELAMCFQIRQEREKLERAEQQSCLLIGPPGTGKTYLVKALSSETRIPVIIPSKYNVAIQLENVPESDIPNPDEVLRLQQLFQLANEQKPCILFLDEIDSIGQDRKDVLVDALGRRSVGPDLLLKPSALVKNKAFGSWHQDTAPKFDILDFNRQNPDYQMVMNPVYAMDQFDAKNNNHFDKLKNSKALAAHDLANLTQLLCSLDGVNSKNVLVIGATNRPKSLDPALIRPGRLNKIIYLDLPSKQKRVDLLKFYSRSRLSEKIDWNYFANQTIGLSPAHLKAALNFSALKTAYELVEKTKKKRQEKYAYHSEASIEYGIQSVTNSEVFSKNFRKRSSKHLNNIVSALFFESVGQSKLWQHVSLGSPIKPIILPPCELSSISLSEKLPTKTETQVWNRIPNTIARVSFPTLFHNATKYVLHPIQTDQKQTIGPLNTKNKLSAEKRARSRQLFYQRHRAKWRKAYLFSDPKTINYSMLNNVTVEDHPFSQGFEENQYLDAASAETLQLFQKYVKRTFKVSLFGSKLLLNSTYFVDNPLSFSTEFLYKKQQEFVIRSSGQFTRFNSETSIYLTLLNQSPTFFITPEQIQQGFDRIFTNPLALHRSLAYNANKAIMVHLLTQSCQQQHFYDIWDRFQSSLDPEKQQKIFIKTIQESFVTRKQFENYLLALSAGKVGEHLMLYYREALPKFDPLAPRSGRYTYDISEIGRQELWQMSWLLNVMIEKNVFYSPTVDLSKQVLASESKTRLTSKHNSSIVAIASNKQRWREFDKNNQRLVHKFDNNKLMKKLVALVVPPNCTYWWDPRGLDLPSPGRLNTISTWTGLFSSNRDTQVQRMPADLHYDTYRPNILRTGSLLDQPFDAKYLPASFVKAVTKQSATWNESRQTDTERLTRALLLDTFAKSFYVLAGQTELSDYLSYYLLRSGKLQANKLKDLSKTFLQPIERERLEQLEKEKAITEEMAKLE